MSSTPDLCPLDFLFFLILLFPIGALEPHHGSFQFWNFPVFLWRRWFSFLSWSWQGILCSHSLIFNRVASGFLYWRLYTAKFLEDKVHLMSGGVRRLDVFNMFLVFHYFKLPHFMPVPFIVCVNALFCALTSGSNPGDRLLLLWKF